MGLSARSISRVLKIRGNNVMTNHAVEICTTTAATCTLGAYFLSVLPHLAAGLSVLWLLLQITWFVYKRYKDWKK